MFWGQAPNRLWLAMSLQSTNSVRIIIQPTTILMFVNCYDLSTLLAGYVMTMICLSRERYFWQATRKSYVTILVASAATQVVIYRTVGYKYE